MRSRGARTIQVNPVDDDPRLRQVTDHPDRDRMEAIMDQKLFSQRIRSERASAYWFAATLWGVTGVIMGAIMGVFLTMSVQNGTAPFIRDNITAGMAIDEARDTVNNRPSLVDQNRQP